MKPSTAPASHPHPASSSDIMPNSLPRSTLSLRVAPLLALSALLAPGAAATAEPSPGERIYRAQCARCHGAGGEGTKKYKQRLEGDRSVAQLAEVIGKTMP